MQHFSVVGHQSTYEVGLRRAAAARDGRRPDARAAARIEHRQLRRAGGARRSCAASALALQPGDLLLLGADLVKPERELQLAYDDPLGVTAAFNKNLLVRINHELGGHFDLDAFDHRAAWNAAEQRIEMHLVSRAAQTRDDRRGADRRSISRRGEHIWTESSYKYEPDQIERMAVETGFAMRDQWIDDAREVCAVAAHRDLASDGCPSAVNLCAPHRADIHAA